MKDKTALTPFETKVLDRVLEAAYMDPSISLRGVGFKQPERMACLRIRKKLLQKADIQIEKL